MSMTVNTALNILGMFAAYSVIALLIPHIVIGRTVRFRNKYERFMLYTMCGNFYVMNLVYFLELLHISHKITLIVFTIAPLAFIKIKLEKIPFKEWIYSRWEWLRKFTGGQLKVKAYWDQGKEERVARNREIVKNSFKLILPNVPEILLILGIVIAAFSSYGRNLFTYYGYKYSDIIVHNSWINQLSENDIFTRGIYPYGYHNVIYYMHEVFGFDTYVILRLFNIIMVTWATMLLLCFLKLLCKSRFIPFLGAYAYILFDFLEQPGYVRFYGPLPQEYSLLFVLPTAYCAFAYFREQRREENGCAAKKSYNYLGGYIISFSMTLSTHFYSTIAAGIFIVAIAIGFIRWFIRWEYFKKLVISTVLSVLIAILPMGIAYATGTELEGSLRWAINVMTGAPIHAGDEPVTSQEDEVAETVTETLYEYNQRLLNENDVAADNSLKAFVITIRQELDINLINLPQWGIYLLMFSFPLMLVLGMLYVIPKYGDKIYGSVVVSTGLNLMFMTLLLTSPDFRLPMLMDQNRASVFFAYALCGGAPLFIDSILNLFCRRNGSKYLIHIVSFAILLVSIVVSIAIGYIRSPIQIKGYESNDAILCLTKIIKDSKDNTWTICGANDEGRMVYGHGFFFELIDFLNGMEFVGSSGWVRIPTETVFFFVEKRPIDYDYVPWEGSGTPISTEYAEMSLPLGRTRSIYMAKNRWICMSRYYYWAEAFKKLYPNEMTVYYESDDFICYRVEQNTYRLFNFAIDYGYNIPDNLRIGGE